MGNWRSGTAGHGLYGIWQVTCQDGAVYYGVGKTEGQPWEEWARLWLDGEANGRWFLSGLAREAALMICAALSPRRDNSPRAVIANGHKYPSISAAARGEGLSRRWGRGLVALGVWLAAPQPR